MYGRNQPNIVKQYLPIKFFFKVTKKKIEVENRAWVKCESIRKKNEEEVLSHSPRRDTIIFNKP